MTAPPRALAVELVGFKSEILVGVRVIEEENEAGDESHYWKKRVDFCARSASIQYLELAYRWGGAMNKRNYGCATRPY